MSAYPLEHPASDDLKPLDDPLGDVSHHTDMPFLDSDTAIGDKLAWYMGDLFLYSETQAPTVQWSTVAKALRIHGLKIVTVPRTCSHCGAKLPDVKETA